MPNIEGDAVRVQQDADEPQRTGAAVGEERGLCWVCGAPVNERHCKIVCPRCGFMRDCSDP